MRQEERHGRAGGEAATVAAPSSKASASRGRRRFPRRERRGLINVMLTVAIAAVAAVVMVNMGITIRDSLRTSTLQSTIVQLEANVRASFANWGTYSGLDDELMASGLPKHAVDGDPPDSIVTPWGTEITVGPGETLAAGATSGPNIANRFWIRIANLPQETCKQLATVFQENSGVTKVANGSGATTLDSPSDVDTHCDDDGKNLRIVFRG
ncbi:MAG: hypothetical protein F4213_18810 [Boseongicola sp. SB0677_bin_26]|nr:hypothetical protein [Boseongicola sp. SB0665_bin_10]MYG28042.1 hypothetical protein [Boseongicola sp. SB0677_bin_26]